jgi:hypothetical protein
MTAAEVPALDCAEPLKSSAQRAKILRGAFVATAFATSGLAASAIASHYQSLDIMLLRYGHEVIDNSANKVVAQLRRQRIEKVLGDHQVMKCRMPRARSIDT